MKTRLVASCSLLIAVVGCGSSDDGAAGAGGATSSSSASGKTSSGTTTTSSATDAATSGTTTSSATGAGGNGNGDVYGPWEGGSSYFSSFSNGPPSDPSFFPIMVWLQSPSEATAYKAIGVNTFVGIYNGPTEDDLTTLASASMPVACDQNDVALGHLDDKTIVSWTQQDEPDNAQSDGNGGYGPCVATDTIVGLYQTMKTNDATRPVYLNFGEGVANDAWVGRGVCTGQTDDYAKYAAGADIVSFDHYPDNATDASKGKLELIALGVDRLRSYVDYKKPVFNWIETTGINDPSGKPSTDDVRAEVWMAIIHGSLGIGYFAHQFSPSFDEHALLDDANMAAAVTAIDQQITDLAPVLNTPPITNAVDAASSDPNTPVDVLVKRQGGALYVFAAAMRRNQVTATFTLHGATGATAEVLGENRTVDVSGGAFSDAFDGYGVHLYKLAP